MNRDELQAQCELGQRQLMSMNYLAAEATLATAEQVAWDARDFDTLGRLLLPLQEARRQRRQSAGDGVVCLDLIATSSDDQPKAEEIADRFPRGQLLVAGYQTIAPALNLRRLQSARGLYLDTFLAAAHTDGRDVLVTIVPFADSDPSPKAQHNITLHKDELPAGAHAATADTYSYVMDLWERLHSPFLSHADSLADPIEKIAAYRRTIDVDYACEFAHQRMADTVKQLARRPIKSAK